MGTTDVGEGLTLATGQDARVRLLQRCCVLIPNRGTGFFVAPRLFVTCAHVLPSHKLGERISVLLENEKKDDAVVIGLTSADWPDIALLELQTLVHDTQVRLGRDIEYGDPLHAFGFPFYGGQQRADGIGGAFEGVTWQHLHGIEPTSWPKTSVNKVQAITCR